MVRFLVALLSLVLWVRVFGQAPVRVQAATPVDIHVKDVDWQPLGKALIYRRDSETGFGLGVYKPGRYEGKVVLDLEKGDKYDVTWFSMESSALVVVQTPQGKEQDKSTQIRIYLLDADKQTSKQVYSETFPKSATPKVEVNSSPKLRHSIVSFILKGISRHLILCVGRDDLMAAPDLDREVNSGTPEPHWSVDGTAVYSSLKVRRDDARHMLDIQDGGKTIAQVELAGPAYLDIPVEIRDLIIRSNTRDIDGNVITFTIQGPYARCYAVAKSGSTVLELIPTNAVLRQIRLREYWNWSETDKQELVSVELPVLLQYEKSNAQDISIWIKEDKKTSVPSTLVAVHASHTWLAPRDTAIAYVIDGALFVRTLVK
jgi:hypothetical protein